VSLVARLLSWASYGLAFVAGVGTFATMVLVAADVSLRAFGGGVPGTLYIVGYYLMIMVAFLPLARVEGSDGMISVDAFYAVFGRRWQRIIGLLIAILASVVYGAVAYASWFEAIQKFDAGAYILTLDYILPIWPAYFFVPISFGLAALVAFLRAIEIIGGAPVPGEEGISAVVDRSEADAIGNDLDRSSRGDAP
jgi:TRAP-type C4-dicarboxylate transport system permease small subunit